MKFNICSLGLIINTIKSSKELLDFKNNSISSFKLEVLCIIKLFFSICVMKDFNLIKISLFFISSEDKLILLEFISIK